MPYILTVALNAAVDTTLIIPAPLRIGETNRVSSVLKLPGGKGINVARVLHALDVPAHVTGIVGGPTGRFIKNGLAKAGIDATFLSIAGQSRTCNAVIEDESHRVTEINEPGPTLSYKDADAFLELYEHLLSDARAVVLSGSLPPGLPDDYYVPLIHLASMTGIPVFLDSSRPSLLPALAARPLLVKPNAAETQQFIGHEMRDVEDAVRAGQRMRERGAHMVAITRGEQGVVLVTGAGSWLANVDVSHPLSSVGSGDAFIAGFIAGLHEAVEKRGMGSLSIALANTDTLLQALVLAVACGAANTLHLGAGVLEREDVERFRHKVSVSAIG
jgi:1-phosphofructokinase family hexose kinase